MVEDYIEILKEAKEQLNSKDETIAVKDLTLCPRKKIFSIIDPVPLTNDILCDYILGKAVHDVIERMFMTNPNRYRSELDVQYKNARGRIDIYDKLKDIVIEIKRSKSQKTLLKPFKFHEEQIRYYMAMKDCEEGHILYQMDYFGNYEEFKIVMTAEERRKQLEKLESEVNSIQNAMASKDPSIARSIYNDEEMKWMCNNCPYKERCKDLDLESLEILPSKQ